MSSKSKENMRVPVLAIDGPSGTGKGTLASNIAHQRNWNLLDSGALYRAFAFCANESGICPDNIDGLQKVVERNTFTFGVQGSGIVNILINNRDVSQIVRSEENANLASKYAAIPEVRKLLLLQQRQCMQFPGLVADGRDMGTTVFPTAILKIFLTATPEIRAERRYKQLKSKGFNVNLLELFALIEERDSKDQNRSVAPLVAASDSITIDTSNLSIDEICKQVDRLLTIRLGY
tara:strand:+ start:5090 stop:5791 length:702 start_codon:yes stop_codon:yes gene_type:complete